MAPTSDAQLAASAYQHPRRPPAHQSVSLRHSSPAQPRAVESKAGIERQSTSLSPPTPASDTANPSISPKLSSHKYSSGESSDAGRWFETTNNDAQQNGTTFNDNDNDPPFFLRNSSSSQTPPEGYSTLHDRVRANIPYRPGLPHHATDGSSSTDDFRGVIDDLTIANKKLKQKLRRYEKVHDAHLQEDKLFEVRFHGLPDHKKKELEETLRKFAAGLDEGPSVSYPRVSSHAPAFDTHKTAESGYASMSASAQNSSAPSNQMSNQSSDRKMTKSAYNRQQQSIQSYLHDIPAGRLSRSGAPMSDKAKKRLVVRRLEQIFAGKHSVPGNHPQPMQQEEVSRSAADADRQEMEATGRHSRPEGLRVARIKSDREHDAKSGPVEALHKFRPGLQINENDFAGSYSPDQRPTRPLDLDPSRAQVPVENMDYIRHLGFTPPDMDTGDAPRDGHGWLYLNLLINMAQLHTLNVTPEFVKDALTDYSSHLELSRDGRKIRWTGGVDVTNHSNDGASEFGSGNSPHPQGSPLKRLKTDNSGSNETQLDPEQRARALARAQREKEMNKFAYTPMFFKKEEPDEDDEGYGVEIESSVASLHRPHYTGDSSGFGSSAPKSGSSTKRKREDGPMIFYTKANFCTDLSGDRLGSSLWPGAYKTITSHAIGASPDPKVSSQHDSYFTIPRDTLNARFADTESNTGARTVSSDEDLGFSPATLQNETDDGSPMEIMDFEASGLGGVQPEDNFSIRVRRSQTETAHTGPVARHRYNVYPKKISDALTKPSPSKTTPTSPIRTHHAIQQKILSASCKTLPTSALPPASYLPFDSTSSGDVDSDLDDSDVSSDPETESSEEEPTNALQLLNVSPMPTRRFDDSGDESREESEYSVDSEDASIDLLATAREHDPNTVRTQEREYDAAVADRLAEEIFAGSSAATAGGGSGFNSPSEVSKLQHKASSKKGADVK